MGIIEEISSFFFDVDDPVRNQKLRAGMMRKIEKQGTWIEKVWYTLRSTQGIRRKT